MIEYFQTHLQNDSDRISFLISKKVVDRIKSWTSDLELDWTSNLDLYNSPYLAFNHSNQLLDVEFDCVNDSCIHLRSKRAKNANFSSAFEASQIDKIEYKVKSSFIPDDDPYWTSKDDGKVLIYNIFPEVYQYLAAWESWNPQEAFTLRYSYKFQRYYGMIDMYEESITIFDRLKKSFFSIIIDHQECSEAGKLVIQSIYSSEKPITYHIKILNNYIDRDYVLMSKYPEISNFYPGCKQGGYPSYLKYFFDELGLQSKYISTDCGAAPSWSL